MTPFQNDKHVLSNEVIVCAYKHSVDRRIKFVWKYGKQTNITKDAVPHNLILSKGGTHIAACREFVDFALNDHRAQDFLHWLRNTQMPDETFFNSLNGNPQLNIPGTYPGAYGPYQFFLYEAWCA